MTWYEGGLRFACTGCGQCCTGEPGFVWISEQEIEALSGHLQLSREEFLRDYAREVEGRYSLREDLATFDCVFLQENRCQVYALRPTQCRTFPWWKENLISFARWKAVAARCEGIGHPDAPVVPLEQIKNPR